MSRGYVEIFNQRNIMYIGFTYTLYIERLIQKNCGQIVQINTQFTHNYV